MQGLGTFTNGCIILLGYLFFSQYGSCKTPGTPSCELTAYGARAVSEWGKEAVLAV